MYAQPFLKTAFLATGALVLTACGDVQSANGEYGRMSYSLYTDYVMSGEPLNEVSLLARHAQHIQTQPTNSDDYSQADLIRHEISPSDGVVVEQGTVDGLDPWDFRVTVSTPGIYAFETWKGTELHDRIELFFDAPDTLDLIGWARAPWADSFESIQAGDWVEEGTQVAFLPIPLDASGKRIAGDLFAELSASDESMIVPGANVWGVYEQSVWAGSNPSSVYFIDAGSVDLTLSDLPNEVGVTWTFEVLEAGN